MIPTQETIARIDRFIRERIETSLISDARELKLSAWNVPDEPVPFAEAILGQYNPINPGTSWGRAWSTMWLHVQGNIPGEWEDYASDYKLEIIADLGFSKAQPGFQAEGIVYSRVGKLIKGLHPYNQHIQVTPELFDSSDEKQLDFFIECAANPNALENNGFGGDGVFSPTNLGSKETRPDADLYTLGSVRIVLRHEPTWHLLQEAQVLYQYLLESSDHTSRYSEILHALDSMCDIVNPHDVPGTAADGRATLSEALKHVNGSSAHQTFAIGHAHIDSAWMWPTRETIRKCARTFSNQLELMDDYPEHLFTASSAQQYRWLEVHYPELYERISDRVAEGKFIPIGSMWVESDTNMPGPEALARQFIYGARYFQEKFGVQSRIVWLPDSFGYSGSLPQIARLSGHTGFFSQKLSWNDTNDMPHKSFNWRGIDGSRLTAHFPPVSTYNANFTARELRRTEHTHSEKHIHNASIVPFGFGNGGGGPTREHLERARILQDFQDLPRVKVAHPQEFYDSLEDVKDRLPHWIGEMYLEFHRGIFTSQPGMKQGNRRSEQLLKEAELWCSLATILHGAPYPYEELKTIWEDVLLYQFHDILPGTSIAWVHREAEVRYREIRDELELLIRSALVTLAGRGENKLQAHSTPMASGSAHEYEISLASGSSAAAGDTRQAEGSFTLHTDTLEVKFDEFGYITSLITLATGQEHLPAGERLGLLQLHRDTPKAWDAWDIDVQYRRVSEDLDTAEAITIQEDSSSFTVTIDRKFGDSSLRQTFTAQPGSETIGISLDVDWQQKQQLLKLRLPTSIFTDRFRAETQFGHVLRTTHANTSWDFARFESCAGRWIHIGDKAHGVAIANDSSYGHEVALNLATDIATPYTVARISVLRAPLYPDPTGDSGQYSFNYSYTVNADLPTAIAEGYRVNHPIRTITGSTELVFPIRVTSGSAIIETIKLAEDSSGDLIIRLYEPLGLAQDVTLEVDLQFDSIKRVDLLEAELPDAKLSQDGTDIQLPAHPFEIITLRITKPRPTA